MTAEIEKYDELKKEFDDYAYIVSHDFKAPLRAINNIVDWTMEDYADKVEPGLRENLILINDRAKKMAKMMEALEEYSRIHRKEIDILETDVNQILKEIKEELENILLTAEININSTFTTVYTYRKKLHKVIREIVLNSLMHNIGKDKIIVNISGTQDENTIYFQIEDNGKGIPENLIPHLFKLFYTVESKDNTDGIGAGLCLAKKTIDFIGGKLILKSEENKRTLVSITWPLQK